MAGRLAALEFTVSAVALSADVPTLAHRAAFCDAVVLYGISEPVPCPATLLAQLTRLRRAAAHAVVLVVGEPTDQGVTRALLASGANDCVLGSVTPRALAERITLALNRRPAQASTQGDVLRFGDVECELGCQRVSKRGRELSLTPREFDLLVAVAARGGRVVTVQELLAEVWGVTEATRTRIVAQTMLNLRKKLEDDPARPQYLRTVYGRGYQLGPRQRTPRAGADACTPQTPSD